MRYLLEGDRAKVVKYAASINNSMAIPMLNASERILLVGLCDDDAGMAVAPRSVAGRVLEEKGAESETKIGGELRGPIDEEFELDLWLNEADDADSSAASVSFSLSFFLESTIGHKN